MTQQTRLGAFALASVLFACSHYAHADDEIPLPSTGGALPQFYIPYSIQYGTYGPAINLEPASIKDIPHDVLISKPLAEHLEKTPLTVQGIDVHQDATLETPLLTQTQIKAATQSSIQTPLDIKALQLLGGALSTACLDNGWVCQTRIETADPEELTAGLRVSLRPVRVKGLSFEGGRYVKARALKHQITLKAGSPLNLKRLEHQLRWAGDNPDIHVEALSSPVAYSPETPETTVTVKVTEETHPLHVGTFFNNIGINQNGLYFYGGGLVHNNVLGFGDTFGVTAMGTNRGSWGLFSRYEIPVNSHGTRLFAEYGFVDAIPRTWGFEEFNFTRARSSSISLGVKQVLAQWQHTRLSTDLTFDAKQAKTHVDDLTLESEAIRQLRFGLQLDRDDKTGNTSIRNEIAWGFDVLGASLGPDPRISVGDSQFSRWTGTLTRTQQMPWDTEGVLSISGQLSPDNLPSTEILGAGGTLATRGYREGYYLGDNGLFVSAQWNIPAFMIPKSWTFGKDKASLRDAIQLVSFVDYAFLHLNRQGPGSDPDEHVLGVGVGIRAQLSKYFDLRFDIAQPLFKQDPFGLATRFHFGLNSTLF